MRRGGRKLSRRMSELIGIFGEEKDRVVGQTGDVELLSREDTNLPSVSVSSRSALLCSKSTFQPFLQRRKKIFIMFKLVILIMLEVNHCSVRRKLCRRAVIGQLVYYIKICQPIGSEYAERESLLVMETAVGVWVGG